MKKIFLLGGLALTPFFFIGCASDSPSVAYDRNMDDSAAAYADEPQSSQSSASSRSQATDQAKPWEDTREKTQKKSPSTAKYPKGIVVSGKKGFVKSPYAEYDGLVDVRGFPSGTMVKCPYTQKIFIVP